MSYSSKKCHQQFKQSKTGKNVCQNQLFSNSNIYKYFYFINNGPIAKRI